MRDDSGGQVRECVELLELTRAYDRQQPFDGTLALVTPRAEHDVSPLNRGTKGSLGGIVCGGDTCLVHEGEEMLIVDEERRR